ncbi:MULTISPECIES: 2Fe-2S iron-sulfur cluster-binding protein [unclassified Mesorhizobium]|uniref:2Fe-2S iron-sulfur cluster-binding protein n=1 Tax=unclassified Mesorhizobium TaxID=325217 RepID=UPI000F75E0B5|nr:MULTISPECIES: 2Fe-2S iron-sulfur cluster-binding protein [unclassified Mesorhizobium]AZO56252.1 2Fe-2S iron-sulfur cluster binding domain-containing protein [Mesorhizobium sp. M8A.F.Ca.ET.057.01.1.1]RWE41551.1 MAG: 2Fe-2S iron-sulfur cluster binding domain-containing protein [Mesorhizobium sp.]TIT37630.1 MAG: 2Fe-2S iron-sulfur cluster binding domain-containing protein [Mesorhizobium sp.]
MNAFTARDTIARSGFRDLRVVAKVRESAIITSFHMEPVNPLDWRDFEPGQFLVFKIPVPQAAGEKGYVLRNYSVSCSPASKGRYRISVKREAASAPGLPDGISSCLLHDRIDVGDVLQADGPRGDFVLDKASSRPVVLLSGGVGLTPMVSMLHALASMPDRRAVFVHACENGDVHALRDEVSGLVATRPGLTAHYCYRSPSERDKAKQRFHSEGMISRDVLQRLLPIDDYEFYLCGPPPFMQAIYAMLRALGVPKHRIAYEFFGPATVLEPDAFRTSTVVAPPARIAPTGEATTVEFRKSGLKAIWDGSAASLLDFAEDHGLEPEFSCRSGICGTCKSRLVSGDVAYFEEPLDELGAGEVLLCCSRPSGSVVLDI